MATLSAAEQMERLQLSDEDTEDLWNSPSSKKHKKTQSRKSAQESSSKPEPSHARGDSIYEREEAREAALREELQNVRNINEVIEGVLESLDRAKGNMEVCPAAWYRGMFSRSYSHTTRLSPERSTLPPYFSIPGLGYCPRQSTTSG